MTSFGIQTSAGERRVFAALALAYVVMTAAVAPWAGLPGPRVPQIVTVSNGGVVLADFCTALVLGRAFRRGGQQPYLVLTCAYLLSAVMALAQLAAFPGALFDTPLIAGERSAAWLFCFWRWALALLFLVTVLRARAAPLEPTRRSGALARAMLLTIAAGGAFGRFGASCVGSRCVLTTRKKALRFGLRRIHARRGWQLPGMAYPLIENRLLVGDDERTELHSSDGRRLMANT